MTKSIQWTEFRALLSANALSMIGNQLTVIAIPWFVYQLTGSATTTSLVVVAGQLPNVLTGLFSGYFIDRFSAKQISLFSDAVNFFAVMSIPVLYSIDALNLILLSSLVFLSQVIDTPGSTARRVMVPELIDRCRLPRERANGLDSLVETFADLAGPVLGGLLLSIVGALMLLVVDALTFALSFIIVLFGVQAKNKPKGEAALLPLWQVWKWMFAQGQILKLALYDTVINAVATPLLALALPLLAQDSGEAPFWLGVWLACFATGTTLTTALYTWLGHRLSALTLLKVTPLGQGLGLLVILLSISWQWPLSIIGVGLLIFGMNLGVGSMVDAIVLQQQVPEDRRGSVFAAFSSLRYMGVPVGLVVAGVMIDQVGYVPLFALFLGLILVPSLLWLTETSLQGAGDAAE